MKNVSHIRLAGGTSSHEFGESPSSIIIKTTLNAKFKDKDIDVCGHGLLMFQVLILTMAITGFIRAVVCG
jgi:hypothetical protein